MPITIVTNKGQVTIPKEIRRQLGISKGSKLALSLAGDHLELHVLDQPQQEPTTGFGMLKSNLRPIPADFDPALLLGNEEALE
jgi:AbrB family looped-hinge helix DNA binding protein